MYTETYHFDKDEVKEIREDFPNKTKEEALYEWACSQGYGFGGYSIGIKGNKVTIQECP